MAEGILSPAEFERALMGIEPEPPVRERPLRAARGRQTPTGEIIPLDDYTGVPFLTRLNIATAPDPQARNSILQKSFRNARIEPDPEQPDDFIIRDYQDPNTGQVKDLLVDERAATLKDIADLGEVGMEMLGAYVALRGGRGLTSQAAPGLARTLTEAAVSATGSQLAGAISDVGARARADLPAQPLEIAQRRSVGATREAAMGLGLSIPILGITKLLNIRRGVPQTQEAANALAARNRLAQETGVDVDFTLGQQTGSEALRKGEEFYANINFGGAAQKRAFTAQEAAVENLQDAIVESFGGIPARTLPNKDVVGNQAVAALRNLTRGAEAGTVQARAEAMNDALVDLSTAITASTGGAASQEVFKREAGSAIQTFVQLKKDALNEVEGQLGAEVERLVGNQPFIATPKAKQEALTVIKDAYEKPGKAGQPLATMPPSVGKVLQDIQELPANTTLDGMRRIRNSVNRQINQGEILGDTDTGVLKQLSKTLTDAITRGAGANLTPEAASALQRYNQFYSEGIEGFQVKGITEILADPKQRKLGPTDIFNQAARSTDQYFRLKDALTKPLLLEGNPVGPVQAGEQTWNTFKQAMFQDMWDSSRKVGNRSLVDPKSLLDKLTTMDREVSTDLLGPQADIAFRSLKRLEVLDNPKLPAEEALAILRQGGDDAPQRILELANREKELDNLYANQVIKRFVKGDIGTERIKAGEFIDRFADEGPVADVQDVMNKLEISDPGLTLLIREKKVQALFQKAQTNPLNDEVAARKLAKEIRSPEEQARLEAILGGPGLRRVNDFMTMLSHIQRAGSTQAQKGSGTIVSAGINAQMRTLTGIVATLPKQAQYWFIGMLLANPRVNRMMTSPVQPLDPTKAVRAMLVSDSAITSLANEFGREAVQMLKDFMGVTNSAQVNEEGQLSPTEFNQLLQQP